MDLQDKMRVMHTKHDSIAQYTQELEEAQQQAAGAGMSITDTTLVIIPTKAMLSTQRFPKKKRKMGGAREICSDVGKMEEAVQKIR